LAAAIVREGAPLESSCGSCVDRGERGLLLVPSGLHFDGLAPERRLLDGERRQAPDQGRIRRRRRAARAAGAARVRGGRVSALARLGLGRPLRRRGGRGRRARGRTRRRLGRRRIRRRTLATQLKLLARDAQRVLQALPVLRAAVASQLLLRRDRRERVHDEEAPAADADGAKRDVWRADKRRAVRVAQRVAAPVIDKRREVCATIGRADEQETGGREVGRVRLERGQVPPGARGSRTAPRA
jgi:hypothetical protein